MSGTSVHPLCERFAITGNEGVYGITKTKGLVMPNDEVPMVIGVVPDSVVNGQDDI